MNDNWQDKLNKEILDLSSDDVMKLIVISEKVLRKMDRITRLTMMEENMVHVAIMMAYKEMEKHRQQR